MDLQSGQTGVWTECSRLDLTNTVPLQTESLQTGREGAAGVNHTDVVTFKLSENILVKIINLKKFEVMILIVFNSN